MWLVTSNAVFQLSLRAVDPGSTSLPLNNEGWKFQFLSGLCISFLVLPKGGQAKRDRYEKKNVKEEMIKTHKRTDKRNKERNNYENK
jgi:hypothetical protein